MSLSKKATTLCLLVSALLPGCSSSKDKIKKKIPAAALKPVTQSFNDQIDQRHRKFHWILSAQKKMTPHKTILNKPTVSYKKYCIKKCNKYFSKEAIKKELDRHNQFIEDAIASKYIYIPKNKDGSFRELLQLFTRNDISDQLFTRNDISDQLFYRDKYNARFKKYNVVKINWKEDLEYHLFQQSIVDPLFLYETTFFKKLIKYYKKTAIVTKLKDKKYNIRVRFLKK